METKDQMKTGFTMFGIFILILLCNLLSGCASYTIRDGDGKIVSQGEARGFMRIITVVEKMNDDGVVIERKISTDSTTKEVLLGLESFIDTSVNTFSKLKPL